MEKNAYERIRRSSEAVYPRVVRLRRRIHAHPELSGHETGTARLAYEFLKDLGVRARYCVRRTGVVGTLRNGSGPTVVLRADMDALPVEEKNDVPYRSRHRGVMHACGHDMHTAALLGAARVLVRLRKLWQGTVVFLFQPSEEVEPGGASAMIAEGVFPEDADSVFGLHVSSDHPTGRVGIKSGVDGSAVLGFDVRVKGRGGHGAFPHKAVDPIVCASSMILDLQTLISRECPAVEPAVLTVGSLHAGTKRNVIPDEAVFHGTIRTLSDTLQRQLRRRVAQCLRTAARSFRAGVEVRFEQSYPSGYNDPSLVKEARKHLVGILGTGNVVSRAKPSMGAEDFAYFQKLVPGLYVHLGVRPRGARRMADIHSATFLPDEHALRTAIMVHAGLAVGRLRREQA
ncbi:MAG: amidohydrolase [Chitinivibrionales bacterium]|nr:amidohydrolase [Chitinivibrionales bacterium]MBD3396259.1 amidohydrolase [Chitinivibrionales bacterium]